jgi:hypothetical protein
MPSDDAAIKRQYLGLQYPQLTAQSSKAHPGYFRKPVVVCIGDDFQQLVDAPAPNGGNDLELGPAPDRQRQCRVPDFAISSPIVATVRMGA